MSEFIMGFETIGGILLRIAGGMSAIVLFLLALLLILCICGKLFDWYTAALARRWKKKGYFPRNKLERIILDNPKRLGDKDG